MKLLSQDITPMVRPVAGILLAGGASRRMGRHKATLPWGNSTLLEHLTLTLLPRLDPFIVVAEERTVIPALPRQVQVVFDPISHAGPLVGFSTGLKHIPDDRPVFLTGCDFPFVEPDIIDFFLDQPGDADAIVAQSDGIAQPLVGLYQPKIKDSIALLINKGERSLLALLANMDANIIPEKEWRQLDPLGLMLINVNTPDEYLQAHQRYLRITSSTEYS